MASILCPNCHTPNLPAAKYCRGCGSSLIQPEVPTTVVACPNCGRSNNSSARFCSSCGKPLATQATEPSPPPSPVQPPTARQVDFNVQGNISGQVAIGDFNYQVQIGNVYGGVVNLPPAPIPAPRPVQAPVHILPTDFPDLLGRKTEINTAAATIQSGLPVEFSGEDGIGKTSLLHFLAHHLVTQPDGALWEAIPGQPVEDILQFIYETFYTSDVLYHPSEAQMLQGLHDKRALVLLDDVTQTRQEVEQLLDAAPGCAFILTSTERRLWRNGYAETLKGLDPQEAMPLVERELGHPLDPTERSAALALCMAYGGHPLHILQAVGRARQAGQSLVNAARLAQPQAPAQTVEGQTLSSLSNVERRVLSALAFLGNIPVGVSHLAEVTGLANVGHVLSSLQSQRLVQSHSPRYSLTGNLAVVLQQQSDLSAWGERYLDHFTAWAESQTSPQAIIEEMDTLQKMLAWATSSGVWSKALRLAHAIEAALALGLRWGAWAQALEWGLQAARALGDRSAEGWALHQIGTRSMCLGQVDSARTALTSALQIRQALGETAAAAITQQNLDLLVPALVPPKKTPKPKSKSAPALAVAASLVGLVIFGVIAWIFLCRDGRCQAPALLPTEPRVVVVASDTWTPLPEADTPTETPTLSFTPTGLPTGTATPTSTETSFPNATPSPSVPISPTSPPTNLPTGTPPPLPPCVDFQDLELGTQYNKKDTFTSDGVPFLVSQFYKAGGVPYPGDVLQSAKVGFLENADYTYRLFIELNRVNLVVGYPYPVLHGLTFQFGDHTETNMNININGDARYNINNFADLDGQTIGGVRIKVYLDSDSSSETGHLDLIGKVNAFSIGGQFWVDNICPIFTD